MPKPEVLLLGRTNVGKSSLFNRLTSGRFAITDGSPHTTRDLQRQAVYWQRAAFTLIDSGGFDIERPDELHAGVLRQVARAQQEATIIVLVVDAIVGFRPDERQLLRQLLKQKKTIIIAANKADAPVDRRAAALAFQHGGIPVVPVSAKNGGGTGDLLDAIADLLHEHHGDDEGAHGLRLVLVGRTNVGKSAITNDILKKEVRVVSSEPHTTRDAELFNVLYQEIPMQLVDTAGVRARGRTHSRVEALSLRSTLEAVRQADVVALVWSVPEGIGLVEKTLAGKAAAAGRGLIFVGNQWDRVPGKHAKSAAETERWFRRSVPAFSWAPCIFTSAVEHQRTQELLKLALAVQESRSQMLSPEALTHVLRKVVAGIPRAPGSRRRPTTTLEQTGTQPPVFTLNIHTKRVLPNAVARIAEKHLREVTNFTGVPITVRLEQPFAKKI